MVKVWFRDAPITLFFRTFFAEAKVQPVAAGEE